MPQRPWHAKDDMMGFRDAIGCTSGIVMLLANTVYMILAARGLGEVGTWAISNNNSNAFVSFFKYYIIVQFY